MTPVEINTRDTKVRAKRTSANTDTIRAINAAATQGGSAYIQGEGRVAQRIAAARSKGPAIQVKFLKQKTWTPVEATDAIEIWHPAGRRAMETRKVATA